MNSTSILLRKNNIDCHADIQIPLNDIISNISDLISDLQKGFKVGSIVSPPKVLG